MTEDKQLYFIEEETTMGWSLIDKKLKFQLSKNQNKNNN